MTMLPLPVGSVAAVGYDLPSRTLRVAHRDGRCVEYLGVPCELLAQIVTDPARAGVTVNNGVKARGYACRAVVGRAS